MAAVLNMGDIKGLGRSQTDVNIGPYWLMMPRDNDDVTGRIPNYFTEG